MKSRETGLLIAGGAWNPLPCGYGKEESGLSYIVAEVAASSILTALLVMIMKYCFSHSPCAL